MDDVTDLRVWAASSGWDGPFQHEEVIVLAEDLDAARRAAEAAFAEVVQPVCRARMRIADLGPVRPGAVAGPRRGGETFTAAGAEVDLRCGE
ncbi:MAG: hypothetical protein IT200_00130 [Thermoleophilia bacterium]|nr:hypothetical protein [Thermoleophilia bacterium]